MSTAIVPRAADEGLANVRVPVATDALCSVEAYGN